MRKLRLLIVSIPFLLQLPAFTQVQVDHAIQLTGNGDNAKITGIQSVTNAQDAASAQVVQSGSMNYAIATGSGNNFSLSISPVFSSYQAGMVFNFMSNQNITGPATLNVNNLGAVYIKKNINQSIGPCDIQNGQTVMVLYDGTNFQMESVSVPAVPATASAGPNQVVSGTTSTTLAGNTPTSGTGLWTVVSGSGGSFSNATSPTATFSGTLGGTYILNWTISACGSSSSSADTISFQAVPQTISGLTVWLDAADASTFTYSSGSSVYVWADKSGNGYNMSNTTTSQQPVLVSNDINGLPAVRFTGSTNQTFLANGAFVMNIANRSIFVVIKENDANVQYSRWVSINGSNSPNNDWESNNGYEIGSYNNPSGSIQACNNCGAGGYSAIALDGGPSFDAPLNIYTDIASAGSGTLYVGGVPGATGSNSSAYTSAGGIAIGAGYFGSFAPGQLDGDYAELIIYNRALTTTERDAVGAYLSAKWGIPFTP